MDYMIGFGIFANAPSSGFQMDGFNWTIAYDATDIVLKAGSPVNTTPEPDSILLLLGAGLAGLTRYLCTKRAGTRR
jgi:hypothetical protein